MQQDPASGWQPDSPWPPQSAPNAQPLTRRSANTQPAKRGKWYEHPLGRCISLLIFSPLVLGVVLAIILQTMLSAGSNLFSGLGEAFFATLEWLLHRYYDR